MFKLRKLACSFCRRREADVEKLVAGGGFLRRVFICDRCAEKVTAIMKASS